MSAGRHPQGCVCERCWGFADDGGAERVPHNERDHGANSRIGGRNTNPPPEPPEPPARTHVRAHGGANVPTPPLPTSGDEVPVDVPVPVPYLGPQRERADLDVQLDRHLAGDLHVEVPAPPKLPTWATPSMERVLRDMTFCSALLRAAGDDGTVIYAVEWAARRLRLSGKTVSVALRRLCQCSAISLVKVLPSLAEGWAGSRVYAVAPPQDDLPARAGSVEADRAAGVDQGEEAGQDVSVCQAVAEDGREVPERHDGLNAPERRAAGEAGGSGQVFGHVTEPTLGDGASARSRSAILGWEPTP